MRMEGDHSGVSGGRWPLVRIVSVARAVEVLGVHGGGPIGVVFWRGRDARGVVGGYAWYGLSWGWAWGRDSMDSE